MVLKLYGNHVNFTKLVVIVNCSILLVFFMLLSQKHNQCRDETFGNAFSFVPSSTNLLLISTSLRMRFSLLKSGIVLSTNPSLAIRAPGTSMMQRPSASITYGTKSVLPHDNCNIQGTVINMAQHHTINT